MKVPPELMGVLQLDEGIVMLLLCIATKLGVTPEEMAITAAAMVKARGEQ